MKLTSGTSIPARTLTFTVDAFPNRVFHGKVNKVRFNATMTQNVVTYTVEVTTDNSDGKLLPYLTANVNFLAGSATNALLVLNSALRWHPQNDLIAPEFRQAANAGGSVSDGSRASGGSGTPGAGAGASSGGGQQEVEPGSGGTRTPPVQTGTLWAQQGNYVRPVSVKLGLTDGTWTQVEGEGLAKGTVVVTGTISVETAADESGANPFVPQIGQRRGAATAIPMRRAGGGGNG